MEKQENTELNPASEPVNTGDGSRPAGSQVVADNAQAVADQAEEAANNAQVVADQAQIAADQANGQAQKVANQAGIAAAQAQAVADQAQAAADQDQAAADQAGNGSQDQKTDKLYEGLTEKEISDKKIFDQGYYDGLAAGKAIKEHNEAQTTEAFNTICDQHSETTESLTLLKELVRQNRGNNEVIKQTIGAINSVVIESAKLLEEIYRKITQ